MNIPADGSISSATYVLHDIVVKNNKGKSFIGAIKKKKYK